MENQPQNPATPHHTAFQNMQSTALMWRKSTAEERIARLKKIQTWIKNHQNDIRKALWDDFKKPEAEVDLSEIFPVTSEINHAVKNLSSWMKPKSVSTPLPMLGTSGKIQFEPKGRVLILAPWNFPFNLTLGPLISAIAAGCPAIIKPSELSSHTSQLISDMVGELFDPSEVIVFTGEVQVASSLLSLPFDHIFFTGSPAVGKIVMKAAAEHLCSFTLELGGKSPVILDRLVDLDDAAGKIVWAKFVNCGQTCIAPDYVLIHEDLLEEFVMRAKTYIQKFYDPIYIGIEKSPDYARIINSHHWNRLHHHLTDALKNGAKLEFGGNTSESTRFFEPTLLSEVTMGMGVLEEEIFGPILPILTYKILDEAIDLINSKPKPLALYYFGSDSNSTNRVLKETSSGNVVINDCVLHFLHNELPFGGVNNSGIGKSHGYFGFLAFSNEKGILKQRVGINNVTLLRPPYGIKTKKLLASLINWF